MRIDGFNPKEYLILNLEENSLKEGSIISGEIIDILEDGILLNIENLGLIKGEAEIPVTNLKGKNIKFYIKSNIQNTIELVPILDEKPKEYTINQKDIDYVIVNTSNNMSTKSHIISNILGEYNIVEDEISVKMLETLFKYNVPVNKDNIEKSIKVLDKIDYIYNKTPSEKIIILNDEVDPIKSDIKDFILVENMEYPKKNSLDFVYDEIKSMVSDERPKSEFIKAIIFLLKNNMTISINNLKNLFKLINNDEMVPEKIIKELTDIENKTDVDKETELNKMNFNSNSKLNITFTEKDVNTLREYNEDVKGKLDLLKDSFKGEKIEFSKNTEKALKELGDTIDFLNDMNKEMNFMYIPITIKGEEREGSISFLRKKNKSQKQSERFSIFINLNMIYLGNVKIICEAFDNLVNININLNEAHLPFIQSYESKLYEMVQDKGYKLNALNYITDKETSLLDVFIDNHKPYYYLDVRV